MKNRIAAGGIATLLLSGGLAVAASAPAFADDDTCVPSPETSRTETTDWLIAPPEGDGWTLVDQQTIVDAEEERLTEYLVGFYSQTDWVREAPEGDGWVQIDERHFEAEGYTEYEYSRQVMTNPGSPAVDEVSHADKEFKRWVVDQEAQPAQYATMWKYAKHGGHGFIWVDNDDWKYIDADGNGSNKKPKSGVFYERTQNTTQVETSPAVPEQGHWEEQWFHEGEFPWGTEWQWTGNYQTHVTQEAQPAVPPTYETKTAWGAKDTFSREWTETGNTRFVETSPAYTEYKFAKHIPAAWVTEVPEGDGWKVKDERTTVVTERQTHEEYRYEMVVTTPAIVCPPVVEPAAPTDEPEAASPVETPQRPATPALTEAPAKPVTATAQGADRPDHAPVQDESLLAHTGVEDASAGLAGLAVLMLIGGAALAIVRRRLV